MERLLAEKSDQWAPFQSRKGCRSDQPTQKQAVRHRSALRPVERRERVSPIVILFANKDIEDSPNNHDAGGKEDRKGEYVGIREPERLSPHPEPEENQIVNAAV